jgi:hypothetical protein
MLVCYLHPTNMQHELLRLRRFPCAQRTTSSHERILQRLEKFDQLETLVLGQAASDDAGAPEGAFILERMSRRRIAIDRSGGRVGR